MLRQMKLLTPRKWLLLSHHILQQQCWKSRPVKPRITEENAELQSSCNDHRSYGPLDKQEWVLFLFIIFSEVAFHFPEGGEVQRLQCRF